MDNAVTRAIEAADGASALARRLTRLGGKITPQAISKWKRIPPLRVAAVSAVTGIPKHQLRPDLYLPPGMETQNGKTKKGEG